jgi:hypothetical protein
MESSLIRRLGAFALAVLVGSGVASLLFFGWFGLKVWPLASLVGGFAALITGLPIVLILNSLRIRSIWGYVSGAVVAGILIYVLILAVNLQDSSTNIWSLSSDDWIGVLPWLLIYIVAAMVYWWAGVRSPSKATQWSAR